MNLKTTFMETPFFYYSQELCEDPRIQLLARSETTMLKAHCLTQEIDYTAPHYTSSPLCRALINYDTWRNNFISNCINAFNEGDVVHIQIYKQFFEETLLQCILMSEMYDWKIYLKPDQIDDQSFFMWTGHKLRFTRSLKNLLQRENSSLKQLLTLKNNIFIHCN